MGFHPVLVVVTAAEQAQESGSDTVTSVFIGAAAVLVGAAIAAGTAIWNVKRQLAHDRDLREVEGLRVIFDESLAAMGAVREWLQLLPTGTGSTDNRLFERVSDKVSDLPLVGARLRMRLGEDHEVNTAWDKLLSAMQKHRREINKELAAREQVDPPEDEAAEWGPAVQDANRAFLAARREYIDTARKHLAVRLSEAE
jgi:hypothetical protein